MYRNLSFNNFGGEIPSNMSHAQSLSQLHLQQNQFSSSLPSSMGYLHNLTELDISSNMLQGHVPTEFGSLSRITLLNLSYNMMSGDIPFELNNLSLLNTLLLQHNYFTGRLPGTLSSLQNVDFSNQQVGCPGCITSTLSTLSRPIATGTSVSDSQAQSPSDATLVIILMSILIPTGTITILCSFFFLSKQSKSKRQSSARAQLSERNLLDDTSSTSLNAIQSDAEPEVKETHTGPLYPFPPAFLESRKQARLVQPPTDLPVLERKRRNTSSGFVDPKLIRNKDRCTYIVSPHSFMVVPPRLSGNFTGGTKTYGTNIGDYQVATNSDENIIKGQVCNTHENDKPKLPLSLSSHSINVKEFDILVNEN
jgi:hypothetical protein